MYEFKIFIKLRSICFGMFILQTSVNVVRNSIVLSPSPALTDDGDEFTFTCTYRGSETVSGFVWLLNGAVLTIIQMPACTPFGDTGTPNSTLYDYACPSDKQSTFTVKQISNMNNGNVWQCGLAPPGYTFSDNVIITVHVSVSSVRLSPSTDSVRENIETTFTCETSPSRPAANITWYKESTNGQTQILTSKVSSTTHDVGDLEKSKSVLKFTPLKTDNGYKIYCEASNMNLKKEISSKFEMDVQYAPNVEEMVDKDIVAGSNLSFTCPFIRGNPSSTIIRWTINEDRSSLNSQTLQIQNITKYDDRMYTCTAQNIMTSSRSSQIPHEFGTDSKSFHLNVLYMASVTSFTVRGFENSTVDEKENIPAFICTVDSNPGSTIEIQFLDKILRRRENAKILTYNHTEASCLDTGVYTCSAYNQYNLGKASAREFSLFVRCSPRPLVPVKKNVTGALRVQSVLNFKGLAYPAPKFTWLRKHANKWKPLSNDSHNTISVIGVDTSLTLNEVSISDYGEYHLKIENGVGDDFIQHFNLLPEGAPELPTELRVLQDHISDSSVLLQWKPGFDGGPAQTFILMYKKTSDHVWINETVEDTTDTLLNYTLNNLVSKSEYQVVIFSQNRIGRSLGSTNITFITKEMQQDTGIETYSKHAMIGGIIGGIIGTIVLSSIVIIASCFIIRGHGIPCRDNLKDTGDQSGSSEQNYDDLHHTPYVNTNSVYDALKSESDITSSSNRNEYMDLENRNEDKSLYTSLEQYTHQNDERKIYVNTTAD